MKRIIIVLLSIILINNLAYSKEQTLRELFQNNEAVIYGLNIRTFNANDINGNGIIDFSQGETSGSFINAIDRLDELKDLGINAVHVLPVTPVGKIKALGSAGSLYALADFTKLNLQLADSQSELSLDEQAKKFIEECHKRNIKVIVDLPSCGAYDLFIDRPDLFVLDKDGSAYIPADWMDVRLFNVSDDIKELEHSDIFILHKIFVNNMIKLGADGIRADVATIKPFIFWKELIKYAREKKPDFFFLAEASESWTEPPSDKAYFTDYKKLLEAGFDGYYGNYFELKNWKTIDEMASAIKNQQKVLKKYNEKKSVIGSFETHDVVSPLLTGGENFSKIIIWLNATLPLNPYYIDGFLQADDYMYEYSNKKASETYTDDEYYYVHQGQLDIFNFSRKVTGDTDILIKEQKKAMTIRNKYKEVVTKGAFYPLKTGNDKIFAYQRIYNKQSIVVIFNKNFVNSEDTRIKIKNVKNKSKINFINKNDTTILEKSVFTGKLRPGEIIIFTVQN